LWAGLAAAGGLVVCLLALAAGRLRNAPDPAPSPTTPTGSRTATENRSTSGSGSSTSPTIASTAPGTSAVEGSGSGGGRSKEDEVGSKEQTAKDLQGSTVYLQKNQNEKGIDVRPGPAFPDVTVEPSMFEKTTVQIGAAELNGLIQNSKVKPSGFVQSDGKGGVGHFYIFGVVVSDARVAPSLFWELKSRFNLDFPVYLTLVHDVPEKRLYVDAQPSN
jgi:hypothetical protein